MMPSQYHDGRHIQNQNYEQYQYVSPQQVVYNPHTHATPGKHRAPVDPALLTPGVVHVIKYRKVATPEEVLSNPGCSLPTTGSVRCLIIPRQERHLGEPSFESIHFTEPDSPGPLLSTIVHGKMRLNRPRDHVVQERASWSRIRCEVDWPGVDHTAVNIHAMGYDGHTPLTRELLANEVAAIIIQLFKANPQIKQRWGTIRLLGLSYYRTHYVPILGIDA